MASEYHWGRNEIWNEISFNEILLYIRAITIRKMYENGKESDIPTDSSILDLLEIIETVKEEKRHHNKVVNSTILEGNNI